MNAPETKTRAGRMSDKRCPKCGSTLLTNDYGQLWCTLIGGIHSRGCNYGMTHDDNCPSKFGRDCYCGYEEAHADKA